MNAIPTDLLLRLSPRAQKVIATLGGLPTAPNRLELIDACGIDRRAVDKGVKELEQHNLIEVTHSKAGNTYSLLPSPIGRQDGPNMAHHMKGQEWPITNTPETVKMPGMTGIPAILPIPSKTRVKQGGKVKKRKVVEVDDGVGKDRGNQEVMGVGKGVRREGFAPLVRNNLAKPSLKALQATPTRREVSLDFWMGTLRGDDVEKARRAVDGLISLRGETWDHFKLSSRYGLPEERAWERHYKPRAQIAGSEDYETWHWKGPLSKDAENLICQFENANCTQFDFAMDFIFEGDDAATYIRPRELSQFVRPNLRRFTEFEGDDPNEYGERKLFGSKKSHRQLAIYEKSLARDLPNPTLRLEVKLRGKQARDAYSNYLNGVSPQAIWKYHIEKMMLTSMPMWILDGIETKAIQIEPKQECGVTKKVLYTVNINRAFFAAVERMEAHEHVKELVNKVPVSRRSRQLEEAFVEYLGELGYRRPAPSPEINSLIEETPMFNEVYDDEAGIYVKVLEDDANDCRYGDEEPITYDAYRLAR